MSYQKDENIHILAFSLSMALEFKIVSAHCPTYTLVNKQIFFLDIIFTRNLNKALLKTYKNGIMFYLLAPVA